MKSYRVYTEDPDDQPRTRALDLDQIQDEIIEWQTRNFGESPWQHPFMGMVEELGELSHSLLKQTQGIRGTTEEHEAVAKDSIGDLMVYCMALCARRGWRLSDIIEETWTSVSQRDWINYPKTGLPPERVITGVSHVEIEITDHPLPGHEIRILEEDR